VPVGEDGLPSRLDMVHQEFYAALHDCGVTVLDLLPALMQGRRDPAKPVFCRQDSHWSGQACVLAARQLADRIRKLDWYEGVPKTPFATTEEAVTVVGDLLAGVADAAVRTETLTLRRVGDRPIEPDRDSPVLLMGDSHCLVFHAGGDMLAQGAGLADQLAAELGFAVDLLGVRGSGARPARIALYRRASQPGYIAKKRVVIWCFAAREFTEADGWGKVPVVR